MHTVEFFIIRMTSRYFWVDYGDVGHFFSILTCVTYLYVKPIQYISTLFLKPPRCPLINSEEFFLYRDTSFYLK